MDPHGVPRKINRHVFKAVHFYTGQRNGSSFPEIYNFVKLCNKNLSPVMNLKDTVRKSLNTFSQFGIVQKDHQQRFRLHSRIRTTKLEKKSKKKQLKEHGPQESNQTAEATSKRRKRKGSDSSLDSENQGNASKRMRGGQKKTVSERKGKKADLPRARRHGTGGGGSDMPSNNTALNTNTSKADFSENLDLQKDTERANSTESIDSVETFDVNSEAETMQSNENNADDPENTNDVSENVSGNRNDDNLMKNDNDDNS